MCYTVFSTILAISTPIPIRFGCSRAYFIAGGYRNPYPYPYPHVTYPQPVRVQKPVTITKNISWHVGSRYTTLTKSTIINMVTNKIVLDINMLRARADSGVICKSASRLVVREEWNRTRNRK